MALGKSPGERLMRRGGAWYYVRRTPRAVLSLDGRVQVQIALGTDDRAEAERRAAQAEADLLAYWRDLAGAAAPDDQAAALARYNAARERARLEGFVYRPLAELADGRLSDLAARLQALEGRTQNRSAVEALLGGAARPSLTLSGAFERYCELVRAELIDKRPDQLKRWRGARELAMREFIAVCGDKRLEDLDRADARAFQAHWLDRIAREGGAGRNAANKQMGMLSKMIASVGEDLGLDRSGLFAKLEIPLIKNTRPPFSRPFMEDVFLRPGAFAGLNVQARAAVYLCVETGMGPEEVSSLTASAIRLDVDIPHVDLKPRSGAMLKTRHRARTIPLVGVSLLAARALPGGPADYFGKSAGLSATVNKFMREHGLLETPAHSLYSLRHSFQDRLTEIGAIDRLQTDLMGHVFTRERYGAGPGLAQKCEALTRIAYRLKPGFAI